jgi:hypothetical protein
VFSSHLKSIFPISLHLFANPFFDNNPRPPLVDHYFANFLLPPIVHKSQHTTTSLLSIKIPSSSSFNGSPLIQPANRLKVIQRLHVLFPDCRTLLDIFFEILSRWPMKRACDDDIRNNIFPSSSPILENQISVFTQNPITHVSYNLLGSAMHWPRYVFCSFSNLRQCLTTAPLS